MGDLVYGLYPHFLPPHQLTLVGVEVENRLANTLRSSKTQPTEVSSSTPWKSCKSASNREDSIAGRSIGDPGHHRRFGSPFDSLLVSRT